MQSNTTRAARAHSPGNGTMKTHSTRKRYAAVWKALAVAVAAAYASSGVANVVELPYSPPAANVYAFDCGDCNATGDVASPTQIADLKEAPQRAPAPAIAEPRRSGRGSPLTLYMEDTNGNAFRLVLVQGTGWKYAEGWKAPDSAAASLFRKVLFRSTPPTRPAKEATAADEPLTVFIDGPSGFTFVWDREGGWKFVGKIVDKGP